MNEQNQLTPATLCAITCGVYFFLAVLSMVLGFLFGNTTVDCFSTMDLQTSTPVSSLSSFALDCNGERLVVGGGNGNGFIEVYRRNVTSLDYESIQRINGVDGAVFGYSTSLNCDGSRLLVGEPFYNIAKGRVHVYGSEADGTFTSLYTLSGDVDSKLFGEDVESSCRSSLSIVGDPQANADEGAVWIFDGENVLQTLRIENRSGFGHRIALSCDANVLAVGAPAYNDTGAVFVYWFNGTAFEFLEQITGKTMQANFGLDVALANNGRWLIVSEPFYEVDSLVEAGRVLVYEQSTSYDGYTLKSTLEGAISEALFGFSVSASADGRTLLVGSRTPGLLTRFSCSSASNCNAEPQLDVDEPQTLGRAVAVSLSGSVYGSTALNATRVGVVACLGKLSNACPVC
jgi:hypothetical protein